jgi:hypothetical protein
MEKTPDKKKIPAPESLMAQFNELDLAADALRSKLKYLGVMRENAILRAAIELGLSKEYEYQEKERAFILADKK